MASESTAPPSRAPIDEIRESIVTPMAVRAALRLDVFTPLAQGPKTVGELSDALDVAPRRLEMLLSQLVVAEFLELDGDRFANSAMASHYLVKGGPEYIGGVHETWTRLWTSQMLTDESITTDVPQAKMDFENMSTEKLSVFLKGLHPMAIAAGRGLAKNPSFAAANRVIDVGGG